MDALVASLPNIKKGTGYRHLAAASVSFFATSSFPPSFRCKDWNVRKRNQNINPIP